MQLLLLHPRLHAGYKYQQMNFWQQYSCQLRYIMPMLCHSEKEWRCCRTWYLHIYYSGVYELTHNTRTYSYITTLIYFVLRYSLLVRSTWYRSITIHICIYIYIYSVFVYSSSTSYTSTRALVLHENVQVNINIIVLPTSSCMPYCCNRRRNCITAVHYDSIVYEYYSTCPSYEHLYLLPLFLFLRDSSYECVGGVLSHLQLRYHTVYS